MEIPVVRALARAVLHTSPARALAPAFALSQARSIALALALALVGLAPAHAGESAAPAAAPLKLSVALGPAFALGAGAQAWAKEIDERSNGTLKAQVFAGATLAERNPALELARLREGAADLAVGSSLVWSADVPVLAVASLPWIAATHAELDALTRDPVVQRLVDAAREAGVVVLALAPLPHRELATRTDRVHVPDDLKGLRVRIADTPLLRDLYAGLGATPVVVSSTQAREDLAAGTIDAQEGPAQMLAATRAPAMGLKFVTVWGAVGELALFAVNRPRWEGWNAEQQELVRGAAVAAAATTRAQTATESESALEMLRSSGATLTRFLPPSRGTFAAATAPLRQRWAERIGDHLVHAAEAAAKAARP